MGNILNIGISGLLTAQNQLQTTSHNISNANTPGFKRQEVLQGTNAPQSFGTGFVGKGVHTTTIQRIYSQFLVSQSLQVQTQSQLLDTNYAEIKQLDNMLAEATSGLSPTLQKFFNAIQDVATNPSLTSSRQSILSSSEALVARFQSLDQRMFQIKSGVNEQITSNIDEINSLAKQVAEVNQQIIVAEGSTAGQPPNDMLDQRDELINQISKLVNTDTVRQGDGSMNVYIGNGQAIVVGSRAISLKTIQSPDNPSNLTLGIVSGGSTIQLPEEQINGGSLGGLFAFRSNTLENAQSSLGRIAITLAQNFNEQHHLGVDLNGEMGGDFFTVSSPKIISSLINSGTSSISASITDFGNLTTSDYQFSYDGTNYTLMRLSDKSSISSATMPSPASPLTLDGVTVTNASILANERFLIQPTINGARDIAVNIKDTAKIAAAGPNRTGSALSNTGTGLISAGNVTAFPADPNLQQPLTITFHTPYDGQYNVTGLGSGLPAINQTYTSGADITFNGYTFQISGEPASGDIFTITPNSNGFADNRNILQLGTLQTKNTMDGGSATYQSSYGQLVSLIGNKTRELEVTSKAQANLLTQTKNSMESISGVNLDEEAANLMRYQQVYQASSKIIEISEKLFNSILQLG
ncbi:flagellar hook-associated protein 1 FlgK [Nitrosomonas sp. PY1]|uniref:flagellar hook-associated protein FlgK n=1 Tax=Nitrosomonas sp. PY1 TaxID=1803906 RepID=UPI001FC7E144|nr:flagellar hook-associated protein FlgK [Nitrosomonas sp. PY1]GKS68501.1 flagellar hook-associated protein 1 FlgK [Nitrosomonas sp. PY1]